MTNSESTGGRNGSPRAGLSLSAAVESRGALVQQAVSKLTSGFSDVGLGEVLTYLFPDRISEQAKLQGDAHKIRAAWNLVSIWLTARRDCHASDNIGLQDAENWFMGTERGKYSTLTEKVEGGSLSEAERLLCGIQYDVEFQELLPYILEKYGSGSRSSVMRMPSTAIARSAKRETGVFYTPADVADYMVDHVKLIYKDDFRAAKVLDPACGTGVFLLAMLRGISKECSKEFSHFDYITSCLHGMDISKHALDAAAFLLLSNCLNDIRAKHISPRSAWCAIRMNLAEIDSLQVKAMDTRLKHSRLEIFDYLSRSIEDLFPRVRHGFGIVIGNPPYANISEHSDFESLKERFASLKGMSPSSRVSLYPMFVEMMWQFTTPGCNAAALVTPLSISFHGGKEYRNCRHEMSISGGQWQFAFFDREPHALFGEEVKTRNSILFRTEASDTVQRGQVEHIATGPLRKWTSRTRSSLFQNIDFTPLGALDITNGIPKLCGKTQAMAFLSLRRSSSQFHSLALNIDHCSLSEVFRNGNTPRIFVGGTAYNFLNVYRPLNPPVDLQGLPLSDSSVHRLEFKNEAIASAAFSILSSRLVFWLWRVLGDGFHVTRSLFDVIPFEQDSFSKAGFDSLTGIGERLWCILQKYRFISVNRGKQTIGFRPLACRKELDTIDAILVQALGLDISFAEELQRLVEENTVVDSTDKQRRHLSSYFTGRHD
jgi:predicted RNA methylase